MVRKAAEASVGERRIGRDGRDRVVEAGRHWAGRGGVRGAAVALFHLLRHLLLQLSDQLVPLVQLD